MDPTSSLSRGYMHDVFPSFCGQDVRKTFLSHFLEGLKREGINTFIDNGIMRSESINSELVRAIKEARIAIVILSKNYASSSWCLNELQLIMECRSALGQTVMTIFYEVDPSDVRKQTGDFGKALMMLKIVMDVSNELPSTDFDRLVGIEAHVAKVKSMMCLESDEVKVMGIWGPAGIGKTTIARALYKEVSCNFQLKYYKENVEGKYKTIQFDKHYLQNYLENEINSGVLDHRDMKIPDLQEAKFRLKHQRVLLILDDIGCDELKALGNLIQGLRFGSKVIVTSEDVYKLKTNGINQIHKVVFPSKEEALQIFSYSAFGQKSPPRSYVEKAVQVAKFIAPFPLGLKVLGSSFRGKTKDEWMVKVPTLRTYLENNKDIEKVIRFALDGLSDTQKNTLHGLVSSMRCGRDVSNTFTFLESVWDVDEDMQTLSDMALISKTGHGGTMVHYLVRHLISKTGPGSRMSYIETFLTQ
ncbi:hypothetical protein Bca52824_004882 [Brassica carinata]|uniref:TIR domain-containing protein n=1 Tax=Brassica carinata TaxID=52824 RepID=A0A8X8BH40_BRACI|nr:hypothetical protein Bca52824_004882 [Brassica carinata]